ncbi:NinE family protein [Klebsiella pneumoniae]|uniref:NinE family protein n=1 Tax=Klebsiella pneumoniae TaxID=573 RepID=UPI0039864270|nr:NinE family protein [Klebsiella pneumoniae]
MQCLLAKVMERGIFRVPARRKRKVEVKPSDIPTFHYTAHPADVRWLRRAARRKSHG